MESNFLTTQRRVSPPLTEFELLRQPLTAGEIAVFKVFDQTLPFDWEIYLQPHMNGSRPDFVLLNPNVGIAVFEVKDWDLDAMDYLVRERSTGRHELYGRDRTGRVFSLAGSDPVAKVFHYRQKIQSLYCPRIDAKNSLALITAGVIFPFADDKRVQDLLAPLLRDRCPKEEFWKYNPISGQRAVAERRIDRLFPESQRTNSKFMSEDNAEDLRGWLVEPNIAQAQRRPLPLDLIQRNLAETRTTSGYRRIKGPAGSGKSLVLAARAANLLAEGKDVLIVSFNITLWHYLKDMVTRGLNGRKSKGSVTFGHFHLWCKDICREAGYEDEYDALPFRTNLENVLNEALPRLAAYCIDNPQGGDLLRYDAIIVDEGQDYRPLWWNVLRKVAKDNAEFLLAADATQDIYGTARAWTDEAMRGAGFPGGRWAELKTSYRLPPALVPLAREFAREFLPKDKIDLPEPRQAEFTFNSGKLKWLQVSEGEEINIAVLALREMLLQFRNRNLSNTDVVLLCQTHETGLVLVERLGAIGIDAAHTFGHNNQEARAHKFAFWMGRENIKVSTFHSFKGWEGSAIVAVIEDLMDDESKALVYMGLTRLKDSEMGSMLTVISSNPLTLEFAKRWPENIGESL